MHPQITDVAVSVTKRVLAQVILKEGAKIDGADLRDWLKGQVSDYLLPATIRVVRVFERDTEGNLVPELEDSLASAESSSKTGTVPLQALVQHQLIEIWQRLLKRQDLTPDSNFFECGGNSFLALRMMTEAEKVTRQAMPLSLLLRGATVRHLAGHILEGANENGADVIAVQKTGTRPPLFFLHGDWIGGGFYCDRLSRELGEDQPLYALPPYHMREEKVVSLPEMAAFHVAALRKERPHGPYLIGGYCIGATVAIEVARQLVAEGETVRASIPARSASLGRRHAARTLAVDRAGGRPGRLESREEDRDIRSHRRSAQSLVEAAPCARNWMLSGAASVSSLARQRVRAMVRRRRTTWAAQRSSTGSTSPPTTPPTGSTVSSRWPYRPRCFSPEIMPPHRVEEGTERSCLELSQLTIEIVPGNHTTCITEHFAELGATMKRIIARS